MSLALPKRISMPLSGRAMLVLAAVYCFIGIAGHAPWRSEDAISIGIVHEILTRGGWERWVIPHVAGEIYPYDGPLFYALAALCAKLFSFALPVHDAARVASALALVAALWFGREATREFFGEREANNGALLLIGCLGLVAHAHMLDGENGALAGAALAWYGLALLLKRVPLADAPGVTTGIRGTGAALYPGALLGAGIAVALLCDGITLFVPVLVAALAAPLLGDAWRNRTYLLGALIGVAVPAVFGALWLAALYKVDADLPRQWWSIQLGVFEEPTLLRQREQWQMLSWATWPLWPMALWALWDRRRRLRADGCLVVTAGMLAALVLFMFVREINEISLLPLFAPLAILAGAGFTQLRRGAANALIWFGAMTFSLLGGLVWLGWIAMTTGMPERLARNVARLEPGFVGSFSAAALILGLMLTLGWIAILAWSQRSPLKGAAVWAAGVTLTWGLAMTLWIDWIDYGKSYAPMAASLKAAADKELRDHGSGCIAGRDLDPAQRAAFHYHAGIVTERAVTPAGERCNVLLVKGLASRPDRVEPGWEKIWEGSRPRERERFRLYARH